MAGAEREGTGEKLFVSRRHMVHLVIIIMHGSILPVTISPQAYPQGFPILFSLGGLFSTPGHAERDNSPSLGLLIDHKYVVLCSKHRLQY